MKKIGVPSLNIYLQGKHTPFYSEAWNSTPKVSTILPYLLVQELPGILFNVALVQVCCQTHEANFRKAKISELDMPHGCNQEAGKPERQRMELFPRFLKVLTLLCAHFPAQASKGLLWDSRVASVRRQGLGRNKSSGFVSTAFCTSNLLFAHSPNPLLFAAFTSLPWGQVSARRGKLPSTERSASSLGCSYSQSSLLTWWLSTPLTQRHILLFHVQGGS